VSTFATATHRYSCAAAAKNSRGSHLLQRSERLHAIDASSHRLPALRCRLMIYKLLYRIPGGHAVQVFTGVCLVLGIGCAPVLYKKTRAGHDYFSSEKPEAVERGTVHGV
jgi:hypothetical protein